MHGFKWKQCINFLFVYINKLWYTFNMPKNIIMVQWYKYQILILQCQKTIELLII